MLQDRVRALPVRKSLRLPDYDYRQAGAYFVTVCTFARDCVFGEIMEASMRLSQVGAIVEQTWLAIPDHLPHIATDAFVVMPNHVHGILWICPTGQADGERAQRAAPLHAPRHPDAPHVAAGSLAAIVRAFKAAATKRVNGCWPAAHPALWQRSYFEHVIRGDDQLRRIRRYIQQNPLRWDQDRENPAARPAVPPRR